MQSPGARARPFLNPRSIAVIGASADENKIGGRPIRYLRLANYQGPIYPINPAREVIQGLRSYPSLGAVEGDVDLAIIAVPAESVLQAVEECVAKRVNGAIIFSSGFAEVGPAGQAMEDRIARTARRGGVTLLGPNCAGTFNTRAGLLATFTSGILDKPPQVGSISLVSQSGAFGIHCVVLAAERNLGLSMCLTSGNQTDLDVAEALAYVAQDPDTEVIGLCIEGIPDAQEFLAAVDLARRNRKPLVVLKLGTSEVGARAAASHTASLTGADEVFDAVLRQHHVYRAYSIDELLDVAYLCSFKRYPANDKLGIITVSGGVGILLADQASAIGLDVAELPQHSQDAIRQMLPFAAAANPVDVTAQFITRPELVGPMFDHMLTGGGYGSAIAFFTHTARNKALFGKLMPHFEAIGRKHADRVLVLSTLADLEVRKNLEGLGYAVFEDPSRAVNAVHALVRLRAAFDAPPAEPAPEVQPGACAVKAGHVYDEFQAKQILSSAGIPCAEERIAASAEEALEAAARIGYPVVMKIVSPDILHKSEIGGVVLNVSNADEVRAAYDMLMQRAKTAAPAARVKGVLLARQVAGGVETILGVSRDPVFGPTVMFGLGGVFVEILRDVTFRRAPFGRDEARRMIREVKGYSLLKGARGSPPADEDALVDALARLSAFASSQNASLESIDINPFIVLPKGQGAMAVDALIETRQE